MLRRSVLMLVLVMGVCVICRPAVGSVTYDYGVGGLNLTSTDWILTTSGTDADTRFTGALNNAFWGSHHCMGLSSNGVYSATDNRAAFVWTAPSGMYISEIVARYVFRNAGSNFTTMIVAHPRGDTDLSNDEILWSNNTSGNTQTNNVTWTPAEGQQITGVGMGIETTGTIYGWDTNFLNVAITVVPEPTVMVLLALGGLLGIRRRK
jgi:hypothetical protein